MLLYLLLLDALSTDNSQSTLMARHKGAPQVIIHEEALNDESSHQDQEDAEEIAESENSQESED
jgi:hypothetical protein